MDHLAGTPRRRLVVQPVLTIGNHGQRGNPPDRSKHAGAQRTARPGNQIHGGSSTRSWSGVGKAAFAAPGQGRGGWSGEGFWMAATSSAATARSLMLRRCEIVRRVANAVSGSQCRCAITIPMA
jgi:hypothetical protein